LRSIDHRRHSLRDPGGVHLNETGRALARRVGAESGPFERVVTSPLPRAMETAHPVGIVRDPFAERLAGARGMAIAHAFPFVETMRFGVGVRCRFLDDLVAHTVATHAIGTVISAGCGLDSRPWRLDLPSGLRWIEVDFPEMLDYKAKVMAGETPKCRLEHLAADLNDPSQRQAVFAA